MNKNKPIQNAKTNWKPTDSRFVIFIDILGFKEKVMRQTHKQIYDELSNISKIKNQLENENNIEKINREYFKNVDVYIVTFSDSIILFSKNDSFSNFEFLILAARYLFADLIKNNIPIKGAMAHGEISINKDKQIYFGQPIIDAYLLEENVDYMGIVCHNSIDAYIYQNKEIADDSKILKKIVINIDTPLKSGYIEHMNIDWFYMLSVNTKLTKKEEIAHDIIKKIKRFYMLVSGSPRKYIDNTIKVFSDSFDEGLINLEKLKYK